MGGPLPDFADQALFPTFAQLPPEEEGPEGGGGGGGPGGGPTPSPPRPGDWHLVAQVKHDMTITKPTLVLADRSGAEFALVLDGDGGGAGPDREGAAAFFRARGLRGGATAVVRRARRTPPRPGSRGRGFVRVRAVEDVRAVPGPLERVLELGAAAAAAAAAGEGGDGAPRCAGCGAEGEAPLMKCRGCGRVRYCGKACQAKGWSEGGHKADCKVLRALDTIFGG